MGQTESPSNSTAIYQGRNSLFFPAHADYTSIIILFSHNDNFILFNIPCHLEDSFSKPSCKRDLFQLLQQLFAWVLGSQVEKSVSNQEQAMG